MGGERGKEASYHKATSAKAHGSVPVNLPGVPQNNLRQNHSIGLVLTLLK